jgi:hypothetical protein
MHKGSGLIESFQTEFLSEALEKQVWRMSFKNKSTLYTVQYKYN